MPDLLSFTGGYAVAIMALCCAASGQQISFSDQSASYGVLQQHQQGGRNYGMGGGAAWLDFDLDGDEDLLVTHSNSQHKLFRHNGNHFTDVSQGSGLPSTNLVDTNYGVIVADYNQDGYPDIYLTNLGKNQLFTNQGNGSFVDDAVTLGVAGNHWSLSAAWADFDADGDLDLYVGDYVAQFSFPYMTGTKNKCYINMGSAQTPQFQDQAVALGIDNSGAFGPPVPGFPQFPSREGQATAGCTLSVCTLDFDEDGDQDLMVGNDFGEWVIPDQLYRNDKVAGGPLTFTNISTTSGFGANGHYNMGINAADYDLDGDWDFYLSNLGANILLQNNNGSFSDVATTAGPVEGQNDEGTLLLTSWGSIWNDFNNDLWEDLLVVNGYIPADPMIANEPRASNHVWINLQDGNFFRVDPTLSGMDDQGVGRGVAASDVNGDGWMDYYLMNNGVAPLANPADRCRLFINEGLTLNPFFRATQFRLFGWLSNKEGIGTRLLANIGGRTLRRQVLADPVYLSSGTRKVHFGTAQFATIKKLTVDWPSGIHQQLHLVPSTGTSYDLLEPKVTLQVANPTWNAGSEELEFPIEMQNHSSSLQTVQIYLLFSLSETGPISLILSDSTSVAPNVSSAHYTVTLPLPVAAHNVLKDLPLVQRSYIDVGGAIDSRRSSYLLP